jgi:hypothetical protein
MGERWIWLYVAGVGLTAAAATTTPDGVADGVWVPAAVVVGFWLFARFLWWLLGLARTGEPRPIARIAERAPAAMLYSLRAVPFILLPIHMSSFLALKKTIPDYKDYWFDEPLAVVDRVLFLGRDAWIVTHELFGPLATVVLDRVYFVWHPVIWIFAFVLAMTGAAETRARFFLSWVLGWGLMGILGAISMASVGPIFASEFGVHGFSGLLDSLRATDRHYEVMTLDTRETLLSAYHNGGGPSWAAISAAPSLHVAIAVLLVLGAGRLFFWPAAGFALLTFIATIHLGWHYAADGILGAAGMVLVWKMSGGLLYVMEHGPRLQAPGASRTGQAEDLARAPP